MWCAGVYLRIGIKFLEVYGGVVDFSLIARVARTRAVADAT